MGQLPGNFQGNLSTVQVMLGMELAQGPHSISIPGRSSGALPLAQPPKEENQRNRQQ